MILQYIFNGLEVGKNFIGNFGRVVNHNTVASVLFWPHDDFFVNLNLVEDFLSEIEVLLQIFKLRSLPAQTAPGLLLFVELVGLLETLFEKFIF